MSYAISDETKALLKKQKWEETMQIADELSTILLDSSLISVDNQKLYNLKFIECGEFIQCYYYPNKHLKSDTTFELVNSRRYIKVGDSKRGEFSPIIELKNINRSKRCLEQFVKCNISKFHGFITLTFADNVTDIDYALSEFRKWYYKFKKHLQRKYDKKDFYYVMVPEFQKRGAVHFHLLTNLTPDDSPTLIYPQEGKESCYDVAYWSHGYTSYFALTNDRIYTYLSKYMTKDIDNRLFAKRRYYFSQNLDKAKEYYFDMSDYDDFNLFIHRLLNSDLIYESEYSNHYDEIIKFKEFRKLPIMYIMLTSLI